MKIQEIATIKTRGYNIQLIDPDGFSVASRKTNCNPAALRQLLGDAEELDYKIDWNNSEVAKPSDV
jgi:hypothetical protein